MGICRTSVHVTNCIAFQTSNLLVVYYTFTMAEVVNILTTCWRLIRAIDEIITRIEQTRDDARALIFLENKARSFLGIVNQGLVHIDTSPFLSTIISFEGSPQ